MPSSEVGSRLLAVCVTLGSELFFSFRSVKLTSLKLTVKWVHPRGPHTLVCDACVRYIGGGNTLAAPKEEGRGCRGGRIDSRGFLFSSRSGCKK